MAGNGSRRSVRRTVTRERFGLWEWHLGDREMTVIAIFARSYSKGVCRSWSSSLRSASGDRMVNQLRDLLTTRLLELFQANSSKDWQWFESVATYDNAKLSH